MEELLLTKREGAASLKISVRSVDYLLAKGVIKPVRMGRRVLLKKLEVLRLAQRGFCGRLNEKKKGQESSS